jgi:branched-subunit amino acid aminotransferase/4-amino-4-deoxychorismate lyase
MPWKGAKITNHLLFALASEHARGAGTDEAFLLDREGYLVEGSRSSVVVVGADGRPALPDLSRGGVAGVAREVLLERVAEVGVRNIPGPEFALASEIVCVNAIRGARPVVSLDGRPVGGAVAGPGPWARRLAVALAAE